MIIYNKKILTNTLTVMIACFFGAQSIAINNIPLRVESSVPKQVKTSENSVIKLKGGVKIDNKDQLITLNVIKSDLRQVLRMLASKAGKNIVLDSSVKGPVPLQKEEIPKVEDQEGEITLDLVNVSVNKAFEYIMTIKQLTYWEDGNTIIVAKNDRARELGLNKTEIKSLKIKYVDAQKVADFLNNNIFKLNKPGLSQANIVTSNPSTNEIYIYGNNSDYELAKKIITQIDKRPEMSTFSVNYANPLILAQKICMTVFQNTESTSGTSSTQQSSSSSSSSSLTSTSSSQLSTICSGTIGTTGSSSANTNEEGGTSPFSSNSYLVLADPGLNQITIYGGTLEQKNLAQDIIKNFDKKEPQVYLEISIIELNENGSKDFKNMLQGITGNTMYGTTQGSSGIAFTTNKLIGIDNAYIPVPTFTAPATYGITAPESTTPAIGLPAINIYGSINSIITNNKGRLLANPRIIASNNTESTIKISEEYVIGQQRVSSSTTSSSSTTTIQDIIGTTGITVNLTPRISPNGYVSLTLEPTYSAPSITSSSTTGLKKERTFKSQNIRVKDGETIVIAGLLQETSNNTQAKTPFLSDLPVVGALFKDQSTSKTRSELIFMITPKIIKDDDAQAI